MPNCGYSTIEGSDAVAVAQLTNHNLLHQITGNSANANNSAQLKGPRLERPRIDMGVDCETWNTFERRWDNFLRGSGIDVNHASIQLFQCANDSLGDALLKTDPDITSRTLDEVKKAMKLLSIIPVSRSIKRAELVVMHQSPDETFRAFAARVRGKAETCEYVISNTCTCGEIKDVNYTNESIRDVLLAGIADLEIRREAFGEKLLTVNDVIGFVESREVARNAIPTSSNAAMSAFKRTVKTVMWLRKVCEILRQHLLLCQQHRFQILQTERSKHLVRTAGNTFLCFQNRFVVGIEMHMSAAETVIWSYVDSVIAKETTWCNQNRLLSMQLKH